MQTMDDDSIRELEEQYPGFRKCVVLVLRKIADERVDVLDQINAFAPYLQVAIAADWIGHKLFSANQGLAGSSSAIKAH